MDTLIVDVFGSRGSKFTLYEDDGNTLDYKSGKCATVPITSKQVKDGAWLITIGPSKGNFKGQVLKRAYTLNLRDTAEPRIVKINSRVLPKEKWNWAKESSILTISVEKQSIREQLIITIQ